MKGSVVDGWLSSDEWVSYETLRTVLERERVELGIDGVATPPAHRLYTENIVGRLALYDYLLLGDAPHRVRTATDVRSAINSVVEEVIAILEPGLREPMGPTHKAAIMGDIVGRLRGNVDIAALVDGPVDPQPDPEVSLPERLTMVAIDRLTDRNTRDRAIYAVESTADLFGATWGNPTAMFHRLRASDLEPSVTVEDLALDWAVDGIHLAAKHTAPESPIATIDTDTHQRSLVTRVPDPVGTFGREYGDTDAMKATLRENKTASERVWSGRIDTVLSAGIQW